MRLGVWALLLVLGLVGSVHADAVRDYYQEPDLNPFKQDSGTKNFETIDPFSGILQLKYRDILLPGNGGMDINVYRTYNLPEGDTLVFEDTAFGLGWNMQYGRVVVTTGSTDVCSQINGTLPLNTSALDNPAFELPDGGREQFYRDSSSNNTQYISRNNWRLQCVVNPDSTYYLLVTNPGGTKYFATLPSQTYGSNITSYNVTAIQDIHGNTLNLEYTTGYDGTASTKQYGYEVLSKISSPDGREVDFTYNDVGSLFVSLNTITAKPATGLSRTWTYQYTPPATSGLTYNVLASVTRPDGTAWTYDYWPTQTVTATTTTTNWYAGFLQKVHYPYTLGSYICYEYQKNTVIDGALSYHLSNAIFRKTLNACSASDGTRNPHSWEYDFSQATNTSGTASGNDVTTVSLPDNLGQVVYTYQGLNAFYPQYQGNLWRVGLLLQKQTYSSTNTNPSETITNTWTSRVISGDHYQRGGTYYDLDTEVPELSTRTITRGTSNYKTTYQNYDAYGNPQTVTEAGNMGSRTTSYTYYNNSTNWILGKTESQTITGIGTISNNYDPNNGDLIDKYQYGVKTAHYTYYPDGDTETVTDARNNTTTYSNYVTGVPQNETHPEGVYISRVISPWGTISAETNGRHYTTNYSYDNMNRVSGINLPLATSKPTTLTFNQSVSDPNLGNIANNARVLERGNFRQVKNYDGFGRLAYTLASDVPNNTHIQVLYSYDALDRKTFETYPRYATAGNWNTALNALSGTNYQYDILNRITRITHPDGSFVQYTYNNDDSVVVTDENNVSTTYIYRAYGDPDNKSLVEIDAPENSKTVISRNDINQIQTVTQSDLSSGASFTRTYTYDSRNYLQTLTNPETGLTTYTFDDAGNMTGKQVGSAGQITYTYDGLNRLTDIAYPGTTPEALFRYDGDNNVTVAGNVNSLRGYQYDANDHLASETINIGTNLYGLTYTYDDMDNLTQITYPFDRTVNYAPDVFGRPTQAAPYVSSVTYWPAGQMQSLTYQNGVVTNYALDQRLRIQNMTTQGVNPISNLTYDYYPNSNVKTIADGIDSQYNRSFTYDGLDRLHIANGVWGTATYNYDGLGNITERAIGSDDYIYSYDVNNRLGAVTKNGSPLYSMSYDIYGNISDDGATRKMAFDDAQNLINANVYNTTLSNGQDPNFVYLYDANNMRVNRANNSVSTDYVYSKSGNLMAEMQSDISLDVENFYLGSQRIASLKGYPEPTVSAGADQTATEGATVTLDGSVTKIPTAAVVSYYWQQISGKQVQYNNNGSTNATFTLPEGVYYGNKQLKFQLTVIADYYQNTSDSSYLYTNMYQSCMDLLSLGYVSGCSQVYQQYSSPKKLISSKTYKATTTINVQIVDANNDGISDIWEQNYFGVPDAYPPTADTTGDGYTILQDYQLGFDPTVAQPLDKPNGFIVKPGINQNTIFWLPVDRATAYDLYWSTAPNIDIATANHIDNVTSPYIHTGLQSGQEYYYKLVARNACCTQESLEQHVIGNQRNWSAPTSVLANAGTGSILLGTVGSTPGERYLATVQQPGANHFEMVWREGYSDSLRLEVGTPLDEYPSFLYSREFDPVSGWGPLKTLDSNLLNAAGDLRLKVTRNANDDEIAYLLTNDTVTSSSNLLVYYKQVNADWVKLPPLSLPNAFQINHVYASLDNNGKVSVVVVDTDNATGNTQLLAVEYTSANGWSALQKLYSGTNNYAVSRFASNVNGGMVVTWCGGSSPYSLKSLVYTSSGSWSQVITNATDLPSCANGSVLPYGHNVSMNNNDDVMLVWAYSPDALYAQRFTATKIEQSDSLTVDDVVKAGYANSSLFAGGYFQYIRNANGVQNPVGTGAAVGDIEYNDAGVATIEIYSPDDSYSAPAVIFMNQPGTGWQIPVTPISSVVAYEATSNLIPYKNDIHLTAVGDIFYDGTLVGDVDIVNATVARNFSVVSPAKDCPPTSIFPTGDIDALQRLAFYDFGFPVIYKTPYSDLSCSNGSTYFMNFYWQPPGVPSSNAGVDQFVNLHDTVILDGTGSSDDVGIVSYQWQQVSGPAVNIADPTSASTSFVATAQTWTDDANIFANPVVLQLTVTDADGNIDKSQVRIYVNGHRPVVDAGPDITIDYTTNSTRTVSLDGTNSVDYGGQIVGYSWTISAYPSTAPALTINNADTATPTIDLPQTLSSSGRYTITLTVTDNDGQTSSDTMILTLIQSVAVDAGPDQVVLGGALVTMAGTTNMTGTPYVSWSQISGPKVTWTNNNVSVLTPSFTAPLGASPILLEFKLTVYDALSRTSSDIVAVTVQPNSTGVLASPVVTPPQDITVEATGSTTAVSIGVATAVDQGGNALTPTADNPGPYPLGDTMVVWSATDSVGNTGTAIQHVRIIDTTPPAIVPPADITVQSSTDTFVNIGTATATDLVASGYQLVISNNAPVRFPVGVTKVTWTATDSSGNVARAIQTITVVDPNANQPPIANAGADQTVNENTAVTLNGTGSSDPDGSIVSYQWTQTSGPFVTLTGANTASATFTSPTVVADTIMTFSLVVTDNKGATANASVTVTVKYVDTAPPTVSPPPDLTVEAIAVLTPVNLGTASAFDATDGALTPTPDQTGPFALGDYVITWSATDAAGNIGTAIQHLTVEDTTPPSITAPDDITVSASGSIAVDVGTATASDIFTPIIITNDAPAQFPVGTTTVTWTATDPNGNTATDTQQVTVNYVNPGVILSVTASNPTTVATAVPLSAQLVGLTGTYEYRFRVKGPATGGNWQILQDYSASTTFTWDTTGYLGKNRVQVQARPAGTTDTPYKDAQTVWVNDVNAATGVTIATNVPNPEFTGTPVIISAQAAGGTGTYEYQFRVKGPSTNNAWVVLQDFSTASSVTWDTTGVLGQHRVQVLARNAGSQDKPVRDGHQFWLNALDALTGVSLSANLTSPQTPGTLVTLTAAPTSGGNGTYVYRYRIRPSSGGAWQVLQDWSASATYQWDTSTYSGSYRLQVQAVNANSSDKPVHHGLTFTVQ